MPEPYFAPDQLDETGCPAWITEFAGTEYDANHMVHVVRDIYPAEALELLGADPEEIRPCVLPTRDPGEKTSLARAAIHPLNPIVVLIAARIGEWTFIYDDLGETGCLWHLEQQPPVDSTAALSTKGGVAATAAVSITGHIGFTYAVDGDIKVWHSDRGFEATDLENDAPAEVRAAAEAAGTIQAEPDDGITMRMICALTGLPRTMNELREIPLLIVPHESRPYLFG
ncbi:hypothetical protein [Nocardia alni]|uniref:hypothetical protein n=1 Tax=Nocardia alni TaxID=2815723 RepID=UPI001C23116B|nr:hypothetical protein [Nocardia alni]